MSPAEVEATRAAVAAALRDLESLAAELAGRLERGGSPRRVDVAILEVGVETARRALAEFARVTR